MNEMGSALKLVIVTSQQLLLSLTNYVRFKEQLGYKVQAITMDQIELSESYRNIKDSGLDPMHLQAYAEAIRESSTETLSTDIIMARAKRSLKLALALTAYLKDIKAKTGFDNLLLVGDFDLIPARFCQTLEPLEFFSDLLFVMEDENQGPLYASIGRIPASNAQLVARVCRKLMQYELTVHQYVNAPDRAAAEWAWLQRAILVLHEERDEKSNFNKGAELIANYLRDRLQVRVLDAAVTTKTIVIDAINQGAVFLDYFGYGDVDGWLAKNGIRSSDVSRLSNTNMLPFINSITSYSGSIQKESFTEQMLESTDGAMGIIGPSTMTSTLNYEAFNLGWYKAIFEGNMNRTGQIFQTVFNKILTDNAHLLDPYIPTEGERKQAEERGEKIEDYIELKNKTRRKTYDFLRSQVLMQILCGDPTQRLPFNLPKNEPDEPYKVPAELEPILTEPLPPDITTLTPEAVFQEFQAKHRKFWNIFIHPTDFVKVSALKSSRITDYLFLQLHTLYYAHKRETMTDVMEHAFRKVQFVSEVTPTPPTEIKRVEQHFGIQGTQKEKVCPNCQGAGDVTCGVCGGSGTYQGTQCSECGSRGKVTCPTCDAAGRLWDYEVESFLWEPYTDFQDFTPVEKMNFKKYITKIEPWGIYTFEDVEHAAETLFPSKVIKDICLTGLKHLQQNADSRIGSLVGTEERWTLEKINLQKNDANFTPIIELTCAYKEKPFNIYSMGTDKQYVLIEHNTPKNYLYLLILILSLVAIITIVALVLS
jgi:hypothetical protein